ncbi:exosome complex exonuclease RRP41 [Thraustotheca clavata]|uniref:Exosome complex exonuclease RRP41 n=1 Tax=Thraustotheca clavata TaxID=74557 RepID=A0A1V9ZQF2_9STRA|nr:exosome complex exonuclease RRP41 [Thraustotheca clavata]
MNVVADENGPRSMAKAPHKRTPLGTLSLNAASPHVVTASEFKRRRVDVADDVRQSEINAAWLDMCCALLAKKRAARCAEVEMTELPDITMPSKSKQPSLLASLGDMEKRDADIERAAELLHKQSQPSTICCGCKTGCLKLYCRCFLTKGFCTEQCTCASCMNSVEAATERVAAITAHLKNNIHAFRSTQDKTSTSSQQSKFILMVPKTTTNTITCRCKKSKCSKKYCDCYQAGMPCGPKCQCRDCCNHTPAETNTKQVLYSHGTIRVIVTRMPRRNEVEKSLLVNL